MLEGDVGVQLGGGGGGGDFTHCIYLTLHVVLKSWAATGANIQNV